MKRTISKSGVQTFEVLDVEKLRAENPLETGIKRFELKRKPKLVKCDVFIAGGGMGGVAAAIRASQLGSHVCLTEETSWLGGQMTSQGVSALDENYMVELSGATNLYRDLRTNIRRYYRQLPGASAAAAADEQLNPGNCWVSWLSFEPAVGKEQLDKLIAVQCPENSFHPYLRQKILSVKVERGKIRSLLTVNLDNGTFVEFVPRFVIDATELGDLLPPSGIPYVSGAESREDTGEPHASEIASPENVQDFVYPFVIEFEEATNNIAAKPAHFDEFQQAGKFSFNGYKMFEQAPAGNSQYLPFWTYRRLLAKENFEGAIDRDLSMINWDSNDLRGQNIIDQPLEVQAQRLALAKSLSLGFLYWLQTEAPRDDGGKGYPELRLRTDVLGTTDGLSKYPYIRESRRIKAVKTIQENDIAAATNGGARAKQFEDSVGIGLYPIDIHGHQDVPGAGQLSRPFQIPLGALVQTTVRNFLPGCKNIGTTHVTNGAYRLHPIEWAIGEAAGTVAAYCVRWRCSPQRVLDNTLKVRTVQRSLIEQGSPIFWFDDVATDHPNFAAIQFAALTNLMPASDTDLHFHPDEPVSKATAARVISCLMEKSARPQHAARMPRQSVVLDSTAEVAFGPADIDQDAFEKAFHRPLPFGGETISRAEFAEWAYEVASKSKVLLGSL